MAVTTRGGLVTDLSRLDARVKALEGGLTDLEDEVATPSPGGGGGGTTTVDLPWFDVARTYGAAGDGVTDDTAAINACSAAGGGIVFFPAGVYRHGTLNLNDYVELMGSGWATVLKQLDTGGRLQNVNFNGGSNNTQIAITNMRINGNRASTPSANWYGILLANITDFRIEDVYVTGCQRIGVCIGGDSSDGNGSADRGVISNVWVTNSGGTYGVGIAVIRGTELEFSSCFLLNNSTHGFDAEPNQSTSSVKDITLRGCHSSSNGESGFACYNVSGSEDTDPVSNVSFLGCYSHNNTVAGILLLGYRYVTIDGCRLYSNTSHGISCGNYDYGLKVVNSTIRLNGGDGISFTNSSRPAVLVQGNHIAANTGWGVKNISASNFWLRLAHNDILANSAGQVSLTVPSTNGFIRRHGNYLASSEAPTGLETSVASAATITLPEENEFVKVTGTTNITSVTASFPNRRVTLVFAGILTFTDGSNLKLAGNFVTTADDSISLVCDGTDWFETSRVGELNGVDQSKNLGYQRSRHGGDAEHPHSGQPELDTASPGSVDSLHSNDDDYGDRSNRMGSPRVEVLQVWELGHCVHIFQGWC
jgi:hypothetical protein